MKVGIFGGSFNPVHIGHLIVAETCRERFALDEIRFIPAKTPPHKAGHELADDAARMEMLELATAGAAEFLVDDREIKRGGTSYTVDTLQELADEDASRELFFLMGYDSLRDFPTWREPQRITELAKIIAYARGDDPAVEIPAEFADRIEVVSRPRIEISSTEIRNRLAEGKSIRYRVPRAVEVYLQQRSLYADP